MLSERQHRNFWRKVRVDPDGCWTWTAAANKDGYGVFQIGRGNQQMAHRTAYRLYTGVEPGKRLVCHTCDNPGCVRKEHLFLGTPRDNMVDKTLKGRQHRPAGTKNGMWRLSDETIAKVHEMKAAGHLQRWIARNLLISEGHVSAIVNGKARSK